MSSSRRNFLKGGGLVLASAAIAGSLPRSDSAPPWLGAAGELGAEFELIRPEDQLTLHVSHTAGFERIARDGGYVLRASGTELIQVRLAPQHVMEWAVPGRPSRPVHTASTWLRFYAFMGTEIPMSTAGFLAAIRDMMLNTHPIAGVAETVVLPSGQAAFVPTAQLLRDPTLSNQDARLRGAALAGEAVVVPADTAPPPFGHQTSLAVSSRLVISPPTGATRFSHAAEPVRHGRPWAEIWSTRLTLKTADGGRAEIPLDTRAIAVHQATGPAADLDPAKLNALTVGQAQAIVFQNANLIDPHDRPASALRMSGLLLSPRLGATTRINGKWSQQGSDATVKSFSHTVSGGRDVFSRIAETGRLYPLGHPAVRTQTVERIFDGGGLSGKPAVLVRRQRIAVKKSRMPYTQRIWPFTSVELLDDTTPFGGSGAVVGNVDYLVVDNQPYHYRCRGIDHAGRPVEFTMPLVFVPDSTPVNQFAAIVSGYAGNSLLSNVHFGRFNAAQPGDAAGAAEIVGGARLTGYVDALVIRPEAVEFTGRLPALGDMTDQAQTMIIRYADVFRTHGFGGANPGEVVLELPNALSVRVMEALGAGGLFNTLDLSIKGTSRRLGPVAGALSDVVLGDFKPETFLGGAILDQLRLFGVFPLRALIPAKAALEKAPKIAAEAADGLRKRTFRWSVPLFTDVPELTVNGATLAPQADREPHLTVESAVSIGADGQPHQRTSCRINDVVASFGLGGAELIRLPVHAIEFVSEGTQKPDVTVEIGEIEFLGVLAFVSRLASLIGGNGFGGARAWSALSNVPNGPALEVTTSGVLASYGLAIPSVAVGMFSIENISFGALLHLPFDGSPRFDFNFATFENPFRLSVSALGGGGFLGVGMSLANGLERVEGALEFGAQIRIDLKVIKGKVSAMGGIYFKIADGETTLTGYLTIHGEVSVLSIITVGVLATLSLTYYGDKVRGEAELAFYVSTFFFSKTVKRTFSRTFAGSNGDPTFAELMAPQEFAGERPWDIYCKAFA